MKTMQMKTHQTSGRSKKKMKEARPHVNAWFSSALNQESLLHTLFFFCYFRFQLVGVLLCNSMNLSCTSPHPSPKKKRRKNGKRKVEVIQCLILILLRCMRILELTHKHTDTLKFMKMLYLIIGCDDFSQYLEITLFFKLVLLKMNTIRI